MKHLKDYRGFRIEHFDGTWYVSYQERHVLTCGSYVQAIRAIDRYLK